MGLVRESYEAVCLSSHGGGLSKERQDNNPSSVMEAFGIGTRSGAGASLNFQSPSISTSLKTRRS